MSVKSKNAAEPSATNVESLMKASTAAAKDHLEKTVEMTRSRIEAAMKGFEDIATFSKENVEAMVATTSAATKAIETLNAEAVAYARQSFEDGLAAARALATAKSMQEMLDLQNDFTKSAFDGFLAHSTKVGDLFARLSKEAMEPLGARVNAATEKLRVRPVAA